MNRATGKRARGVDGSAESLRAFLLAQVRVFVMRVRGMTGVRRVALIGSLTTPKSNPKDADLLVWVDDGADLASLAVAARQLQGKAQSRNNGADIFLARADGTYLGRICHYRDCRPGVRIACRAQHCGRKAHLCDDLDVITLPRRVIQAPAVDLWPQVVVRLPVPDDVQQLLSTIGTGESTFAVDAQPQQ